MIHPADKAVLRLAIGLGLAAAVAYGAALPLPYVVCLMAVLVLGKPGPPMPPLKGLATAVVLAGLVSAGVLMVPLLEHYPPAGVLLTGGILYTLFFLGRRTASPLTLVLVVAFTLIPVAGVAEQGLVTALAGSLALGIVLGSVVGGISHAFFPDPPGAYPGKRPPPAVDRDTAHWIALRGTLAVLPMFGLALHPTLWMLVLWLAAAALWTGARLYRVRPSLFPPSFWNDALVTAIILAGPAIEDSANGKDVFAASAMRVSLFVALALYAWAMVWLLEGWRARKRNISPPGEEPC